MVLDDARYGLWPIHEGPGLNVAAVENALRRLWTEHATNGEEALLRGRALNLIVWMEDEAGFDETQAALDEIIIAHPCRALFLLINSDAPSRTARAYIAARCVRAEARSPRLCGEQILFIANPDLQAELLSAVAVLLYSDLPTFLWWKGASCDDEIFYKLCELSDRAIVDSSLSRKLHDQFRSLDRLLRDKTLDEVVLSDLEWARINEWRATLAESYDTLSGRAAIRHARTVSIEHTPFKGERSSPQALLFAGWLASRLKWRLITPTGPSLLFDADDRRIELRLRQNEAQGIEPGRLTAVEFMAGAEPSLRISVSESGGHIETRISGRKSNHVARCDDRSEGCLMRRELEELGRDHVYEQALSSALEILEAL